MSRMRLVDVGVVVLLALSVVWTSRLAAADDARSGDPASLPSVQLAVLQNLKVGAGNAGDPAIFGEVKNVSCRTLSRVSARFYLLDKRGRRIDERVYAPVSSSDPPLRQNYVRAFSVRLEHTPQAWSGEVDAEITDFALAKGADERARRECHQARLESSGVSPRGHYLMAIKRVVERNWRQSPSFAADSMATVRIDQTRSGDITDIQIVRCSGGSDFCESVVDAIRRASPLPAAPNSEVFDRTMEFTFRPTGEKSP